LKRKIWKMFSDERIASADLITPSAELTANGSTVVNGHADLPARSGPPRSRKNEHVDVLSPARQALQNHQQGLAELQSEVERVSKPVAWLRDKLSAATAELGHAEAELAQIDAQHAAAIAKAARENTDAPSLPASSADAEGTLQRARRNCNSVRQAMTECEQDLQRANQNMESARSGFDQLVLGILVEEHSARLRTWQDASAACFAAEAALLALEQAIGERGRELHEKTGSVAWLQKLEALRKPIVAQDGLGPRDLAVASQRWGAVLHRLASDPSATF
jgi:chromosome segregation ATPase